MIFLQGSIRIPKLSEWRIIFLYFLYWLVYSLNKKNKLVWRDVLGFFNKNRGDISYNEASEYKAASKKVYKESCIQKDELKELAYKHIMIRSEEPLQLWLRWEVHEGGWNQGLLVPPQQSLQNL